MFSILLIINLVFETFVQPTMVATGFQNAVNTEGGCFSKMSLKTIADSASLEDDDDENDDDLSDSHKKNEGFITLHPTTVGFPNTPFLKMGKGAMSFAQSRHTFLKRRLFILFHDLKVDC